jgi:hypothetical protein
MILERSSVGTGMQFIVCSLNSFQLTVGLVAGRPLLNLEMLKNSSSVIE